MASVERIFLGWDRPPIIGAAEWLLTHARAGELDLSSLTVVVPGARAGRVLLSLLVERAGALKLVLSPPMCVTPGEAADAALGVDDAGGRSPAGPMVSKLAWVESLRAAPREELRGLIAEGGARGGLSFWSGIADALMKCHEDLAGEGLVFADVGERGRTLAAFEEEDRWKAASATQDRYERTLEKWGLYDSALRRLRRLREPRRAPSADIVLLGVAELNGSSRAALRASGVRVRALVFAPAEMSGAFDEFGCVKPDAWQDRALPVAPERIEFANGPADQADSALGIIGGYGGAFAAHEIVIGVPDAGVVPALERAAAQCEGVRVRAAAGTPFFRSAPGAALRLVCGYLESRTWDALAALVRHADVERWINSRLNGSGGWMVAIDRVRRATLAERVNIEGLSGAARDAAALVEELTGAMGEEGERALREWPARVLELLRVLYGSLRIEQNDPHSRRTVEACRVVKSRLAPLAECGALDSIVLGGAEFLSLLLDELEREPLPPRADDDAIELLGWLELAMDPAPAVVVTGMNEGSVPAAFGADPFLPNTLRQHLGMACDRARLARDLYLATLLCHSRREVHFIGGRRDAEGSPITPSRVLFSAGPSEVVRRLALYAGRETARGARPSVERALRAGGVNLFTPRPRAPVGPITSMRVTSFRSYLASPYRFFLEAALGLEEVDEPGPELDAGAFGSLIHEALREFGRGRSKNCEDEGEIRDALVRALDARALKVFGEEPPVPVWLQLRAARMRLERFAREQAAWRREGWSIRHVEWSPPEDKGATIMVDENPFGLRGKVDRIDVHADGRVAILDYKTGDTVKEPGKTHRTRAGWVDLQLPLYRHLARGLELFTLTSDVTLGYIALPRDPAETAFLPARWQRADLEDADKAAADVVRAVREQRFWSVGRVYRTEGALDAVCGLGLLGEAPGADDEGEVPA